MAARITGGRTAAPKRPTEPARRAARREDLETRRLWQLCLCGGAFVLLVAAKLLLPAEAAPLREALGTAMERNMDVEAVFSAVGRTFGGVENASSMAEEVWQAVFQPGGLPANGGDGTAAVSGTAEAVPAEAPARAVPAVSVSGTGGAALDALREYRREAPTDAAQVPEAAEPDGGRTDSGQPDGASPQTPMLYSGRALPDRVSMEQAILGFDYCTPVMGTLTSGFGYRNPPGGGEERFHYGIDLAAERGTAILCFAAGTVTAVGDSTSYGKYCMAAHANGCTTLYAHCDTITVTAGQAVAMGQTLGTVGDTGNATGPHLHFELQKDSVYLNPVYYAAHG